MASTNSSRASFPHAAPSRGIAGTPGDHFARPVTCGKTRALWFSLAVSEVEGRPLVLDTALGEALGMAKPAMIRTNIIAKHIDALKQFGPLLAVKEMVEIGSGGKREVTAFYLNEEQAVYVTMHARTDRAEAVKVQIVKVFTACLHGGSIRVCPWQIDQAVPFCWFNNTV